jgi:hypothetical protein
MLVIVWGRALGRGQSPFLSDALNILAELGSTLPIQRAS